MRRLLSLALVVCMLCAFIPASFASAEVDNLKLVYGINVIPSVAYSDHTDGPGYNLKWNNGLWKTYFKDITTYEKTGGFWKYNSHSGTLGENAWVDGSYWYINFARVSWLALDFYVPEAGTYDVTVHLRSGYGDERNMDFYVLPGSKTSSEITSAFASATPVTATIEKAVAGTRSNVTMEDVALTAGTNVIVFKKKNTSDYFTMEGFSVTKGDGSVGAPMGVTALSASELEVGQTATPSIARNIYNLAAGTTLYNSLTWGAYTAQDVTYKSSNEAVAKINASGLVEAVGLGTAEIYALVNGSPIVGTSLTVKEAPGVKYTYGFGNGNGDMYNRIFVYSAAGNSTSTSPETGFSYSRPINTFTSFTDSMGFFHLHKNIFTGNRYIRSNAMIFAKAANYINRAEHAVLKLWVPKAGTYDVTASVVYSGQLSEGTYDSATDDGTYLTSKNEFYISQTDPADPGALTPTDPSFVGYFGREGRQKPFASATKKGVALNEGVNYVTVISPAGASGLEIGTITIQQGDGSLNAPMGATKLDKAAIEVNETAKASYPAVPVYNGTLVVAAKLYNSGDHNEYDATGKTITYKSSNTNVATVDSEGNVKGVGQGTAEISAVIDGYALAGARIEVTAPDGIQAIYAVGGMDGTQYALDHAYGMNGNVSSTQIRLTNIRSLINTNGFWRFAGTDAGWGTINDNGGKTYSESLWCPIPEWYALGFHVPKAANYDIELTPADFGHSGTFEWYIFPAGSASDITSSNLTSGSSYYAGEIAVTAGNASTFSTRVKNNVALPAGESYIVFKQTGDNENFFMKKLAIKESGTAPNLGAPMGLTSLTADSIEVGGGTTAGTGTKLYNSLTWGVYTAQDVTYRSSNTSVATVNDLGVVKGVGVGSAEITAIVDGYELPARAITVSDATVSGTVAFLADGITLEDILGLSAEDEAAYVEGEVNQITAGTRITLTAPEKTGEIFRYWKIGGENGRVVSSNETYSFTLYGPTYITPVYDAETASGTYAVELWNANGTIIEMISNLTGEETFGSVVSGKSASLTGYGASTGWSIDNEAIINAIAERAIVRAIATYSNPNAVTLTVDGDTVNTTYGADVEIADATEAGVWKLDGQVVRYAGNDVGYTYDRFAWGGETIEFVAGKPAALNPVVAIASEDKNGAVMVEYDAGIINVREAGIIFGNSANIMVDSCTSKASTDATSQHGQITASRSGSETYARGYIVYVQADVAKVVYTDALYLA